MYRERIRRESEPVDFWTHFKLLENLPKECMKILSKLYRSNSAQKSEVTKSYNPIHNHNNLRVKSPLHYALKSGACFAIIQFILDNIVIAECMMLNCDGKWPFHYAAIHTTNEKIIKLVGERIPELCAICDNSGLTALHYAIQNSRKFESISNIVNCSLLFVEKQSNFDVAEILLNANKKRIGATPLHMAMIVKSDYKVIEFKIF